VSDAVLFLCSDAAKYITGIALPIDAGNTAR
jgi:NAD(P)-dependent dehydrogenase (short-subunit alcohol dehydrogenase family)